MKKMDEKLSAKQTRALAVKIKKFQHEIETEEIGDDDSIDWRVAHVGDVGSDSWDMQLQEIELELEKKLTQHIKAEKAKKLQRLRQQAKIAKPHVEALALKQEKRKSKKL